MAGGNKILYLYDAIGNKLCKKIMKDNVVQNTTDYSGSFIYETGSSGYIAGHMATDKLNKSAQSATFTKAFFVVGQ